MRSFWPFALKVTPISSGKLERTEITIKRNQTNVLVTKDNKPGEEKLTAAEWGIDWGRKASRGQLDLCLCWLKLTDNCSWIFLHQPPFSPLPPIFFFFLVSRSCVFPLVLNHLDTTNLDSVFKSRDITLPAKVQIVKAMTFPAVSTDVRVGP